MKYFSFVLVLLLASTAFADQSACDSWPEHNRAFQAAHQDAELFDVSDVGGFYDRWKVIMTRSEPGEWNIDRPDRIYYFRSTGHATSQVLFVEGGCISFWGFFYNWQMDTVLLPDARMTAEKPET